MLRFLKIAMLSATMSGLSLASHPSFAKADTSQAEAYAALPFYSEPALSPNGKQIAYITNVENRRFLVMEDLGGGNQSIIPPIAEADIMDFHWANDNRMLVIYEFAFKRRDLMVQSTQTHMAGVDRDGQNFDWIVEPEKEVPVGSHFATRAKAAPQFQHDILDMLPDDPDHIILSLDADRDGSNEIRKMNVYTKKFETIRNDERGVQNWTMDHHGELRYGSGYSGSNWYERLKTADGSWINIEGQEWNSRLDIEGFTDDPNIVYVSGTNENGKQGLYKLALDSGELVERVFEHPQVDMDYVVTHPITREPIGVAYTIDHRQVHYFHPTWAKVQALVDKSLPGMSNRIVSKARGQHIYLIRSSSDQEPGVYYLLDIKGKKLELISPSRPHIDPSAQGHTQAVSIPVRDGSTIPGYLTLPAGVEKAKKLPTVIMPHGGPPTRSTADWDYEAQFLASLGYAVLQPNFRGSTGYGTRFYMKGRKQWGGLMQDDVTDATKWLIKEKIADKKSICIVGGSYGGYAALMGAIKEPNLYKCAASINGVTDILEMKVNDKHFIGGRAWTKNMVLEGARDKDISPYHRADEIKAAVLLVAATDDTRVDYRLSKDMHKRLLKQGKKSTYVELESGGHSLDTGEARLKTLKALESFLAENIGN